MGFLKGKSTLMIFDRHANLKYKYGGANDYSRYTASKESLPGENANRAASAGASPQHRPSPVKAGPKVGRNDPCPCGSGKKYKNCCGKEQ